MMFENYNIRNNTTRMFRSSSWHAQSRQKEVKSGPVSIPE